MKTKETNPKALELLATLKELQTVLKHTDKINLGDFYRSNGIKSSIMPTLINKHLLNIDNLGSRRSIKWATINPNLAMCNELISRSKAIKSKGNKEYYKKNKIAILDKKQKRTNPQSDIKLLNHLKELKRKLDNNELFRLADFHRENGYTNGYLTVSINDVVLENARNKYLREWKIGEPTIKTVKQIKDNFNIKNTQSNKDVKIPLKSKKEKQNKAVLNEPKKVDNTKQAVTKKRAKKRVKTTNEYSIYLFGLRILTIKRN